jgi:hypothetical protein
MTNSSGWDCPEYPRYCGLPGAEADAAGQRSSETSPGIVSTAPSHSAESRCYSMINPQKRHAVLAELKVHPRDSTRSIAARLGVSHTLMDNMHNRLPTAAASPVPSRVDVEREEPYRLKCLGERTRLGIPVWSYSRLETEGLDPPGWVKESAQSNGGNLQRCLERS